MKLYATALLAASIATQGANAAPPGYFDLAPGVTLETGDTWNDGAKRYRIYGIQSCIRGTFYTDNSGQKQDCGDASLAVLAAFIKDTKPVCAPAAETSKLTYVVCYATVGNQRLDLATSIVTQGFAFAALNENGMPVFPAYAVAEQEARSRKAGLWQFSDVQHPSILLSARAKAQSKDASK